MKGKIVEISVVCVDSKTSFERLLNEKAKKYQEKGYDVEIQFQADPSYHNAIIIARENFEETDELRKECDSLERQLQVVAETIKNLAGNGSLCWREYWRMQAEKGEKP